MKTCTKCRIEKPAIEFAKNSRKKDGLQDWCKSCKNGHHRDYYGKNKSQFVNYAEKRKREMVAWLQELKTNPCSDCGGKFHPVAMQWHHRDAGTKIENVSNLIRYGSRQRVLDEIAKCDLLCANCHAVRTHATIV